MQFIKARLPFTGFNDSFFSVKMKELITEHWVDSDTPPNGDVNHNYFPKIFKEIAADYALWSIACTAIMLKDKIGMNYYAAGVLDIQYDPFRGTITCKLQMNFVRACLAFVDKELLQRYFTHYFKVKRLGIKLDNDVIPETVTEFTAAQIYVLLDVIDRQAGLMLDMEYCTKRHDYILEKLLAN